MPPKPAEKKDPPPPRDLFVELITLFFVILILGYFINGLINTIQSSKIFSQGLSGLTPKGLVLSRTRPIASLLNPVGSSVLALDEIVVYSSPNGNRVGVQKLNSKGKILQGPVKVGSNTYWYVDFESGDDGWVRESDIGALLEKTKPLSQIDSMLGKDVIVSDTTPVYEKPGGNQIATKEEKSKGNVIEGPLVVNKTRYWHIQFQDGTSGWVPEKNLDYAQTRSAPLNSTDGNTDDAVIVSKSSTIVYAEPGGDENGTQSQGSEGSIIAGPVEDKGVTYWKIRFIDGEEGWVSQDDLNKLEYERTALSQIPTVIGGKVRVSQKDAPLYDSAGGAQIGTEDIGMRGKVIEGPLVVDGVRFWHIEFNNGDDGWIEEQYLDYVDDVRPGILDFIITSFWNILKYVKYLLWFLCVPLIFAIVYIIRRIKEIKDNEKALLYPQVIEDTKHINPRWQTITDHIESLNENDWRLAILDADIMLDELLDKMALPGETMGEKLKSVEKSDFTTIDNAWEAHKFRNQIAHEGLSFQLTQREARRIIELYRSVFEEFGMI